MRGQKAMDFFTGSVIIDYGLVFWPGPGCIKHLKCNFPLR